MNVKDAQSLVGLIREARRVEVILVSMFLLPVLLTAWSALLNSLTLLDTSSTLKLVIVCAVALMYVAILAYVGVAQSQDERLERARRRIAKRLERRGGHRASFDAIRSEVDPHYKDSFLQNLIDEYPETFRKCKVKSAGQEKAGITLELRDPSPTAD